MLEGAPNFRDLGGIAAEDGRIVRPGRIYRSEVLSRLTPADLARVARLDVRLVCDLRSAEERAMEANRWPAARSVQTVRRAGEGDPDGVKPTHWTTRIRDPDFDGERAREAMIEAYRTMPAGFARPLAALLAHLCEADGGGALVHCVAGKDRTGFVCAMVLRALDVPMPAILDDYLASAERFARSGRVEAILRERFGGEVPVRAREAAAAIAGVRREYLQAAMDEIEARFDSVDAYLARVVGLDRVRRERLKRQLLAPQGAQSFLPLLHGAG